MCENDIDGDRYFDEQAKKKVSFGLTTITEIPDDFVTILEVPEESKCFAKTIQEAEEEVDVMETINEPEERNDIWERSKQPMGIKSVSTTMDEPKETRPPRGTTIKFAPATVIKESPANHLPTLKTFPDFCTASKPIFRPGHKTANLTSSHAGNVQMKNCECGTQVLTTYSTTLTSFPDFVEVSRPSAQADLERLRRQNSRCAPKR